MYKRIDRYDVVSCTGYISENSDKEDKCPFFSPDNGYCSLLEINISGLEDGSVPKDCDLRKADILVSMKGD